MDIENDNIEISFAFSEP